AAPAAARQDGLPAGVTSLMLRNLPRALTQRQLLDEVHSSGFAGKCDFCYVPRDFTSGQNRGQAFVNFSSPEVATEFRRAWRGRTACAGQGRGGGGPPRG
ncbi:unnamed protein product, partial [Prorocentrum cordatum]